MNKKEFWEKCIQFLKNNELELSFEGNFQFSFLKKFEYYRKNNKTSGIFNNDDYYLLLDVSVDKKLKKEDVEFVHESFRIQINSKFKTQRWLRFRVPNIVTIFIAESMPEEPIVDYIKKVRRPWQGGEIHNVVWISTNDLSIITLRRSMDNINDFHNLILGNKDPNNHPLKQLRSMMRYVLEEN